MSFRSLLNEKFREALRSTLPIVGIVLLLCFTIAPIPSSLLMTFVVGAMLLIVGIAFFTLGADTAMTPIGNKVGAQMTSSHKLWLIILGSFVLGAIITISEPDLQVLANQVPAIPNAVLIGAVAVGVGLFLVVAMLRILFAIRLSWLLVCFYVLIFALAAFVPADFLAGVLRRRRRDHRPHDRALHHGAGRGRVVHPLATARPGATASAWWRLAPWGPFWRCWCWGSASPARAATSPSATARGGLVQPAGPHLRRGPAPLRQGGRHRLGPHRGLLPAVPLPVPASGAPALRQDSRGSGLYLCGTGAVPHRRQRRASCPWATTWAS